MPDSPEQIPDVYHVLTDLRNALGNASQITGYCLDLKTSSDRMLPLVTQALRQLQEAIAQALPSLPAEEGERDE
jgi:hypothetical protein